MNFFLDWSNIINPERRDIVFEHRNKRYGGFVLREEYTNHILFAMLISIMSISLVVSAPLLISYFSRTEISNKVISSEGINLEEPPPIDKTIQPPPPYIPPPPVKQTIKFTPPLVVKDDDISETPPTQEETKSILVGVQTQEGINDIMDLPPDPGGDPDDNKIFTVVEEMPSFPGGEAKLMEYLSHIRYPALAREEGVSGWVYLSFVIDKDGKIKDAIVVKGIGGGCDEEALRVLRALPDWKPGRQNGRNVLVRNNIRINFSLK